MPEAQGRSYRLCANYTQYDVCNWAVPAHEHNSLCAACRLTTVIPDASDSAQRNAWFKLETAKRRLVYSLMMLGLPLSTKAENPQQGLAFEFKTPGITPDAQPVLTGHAGGTITINTLEADDAEREKRRTELHEPYRTLLGHFRHEIGHYYWDLLIAGSARLEPFRQLFGDEQLDYGAALKAHYDNGAPPDWQQRYVSAYCSSHPWEDWAETWAHYLHMADTLQTAAACGLRLRPGHKDEPSLRTTPAAQHSPFDPLIADWFAVTYVLNSLNRGVGQGDAYPFVLAAPAIEKLRFVHETIRSRAA